MTRKNSTTTSTTPTPAKVAPVVPAGARDKAVALTTTARQAGRQASILQAEAVAFVDTANLIGKHDGAVWATWADYALALGVNAKSGISRLRTLAYALQKGIVPDSKVDAKAWGVLSDKATEKGMREAVTTARTRVQVRQAILATAKANEKATSTPGNGDAGTPGKGATPAPATGAEKDAEKGPAMPRNNSGRLDLLETVLATLDVKAMTDAEWKRLAEFATRVEAVADARTAAKAKRSKRTA